MWELSSVNRLKVIGGLQAEPELGSGPQRLSQKPCHLGSNASPAIHDVGYRRLRLANSLGKPILANAHRLEKLFEKNLTWGGNVAMNGSHRTQLLSLLHLAR